MKYIGRWLVFIGAMLLVAFLYWYGQHQSFLKQQLLESINSVKSKVVLEEIPGPKNLSAQAVFLKDLTDDKIVYEQSSDLHFYPASLSKLMSALIILENYPDLEAEIKISQKAISIEGDAGNLKVGETFTVRDLLKMALIMSSNDAVYALAESIGINKFVGLMNQKAQELNLSNTGFFDPTGLDEKSNFSTAQDLANLAKYILKWHPLVSDITLQKSVKIYSLNTKAEHIIITTDELLEKIPNIVLAKTGYTVNANECFLIIYNLEGHDYVSVVLDSNDRFGDTLKLYRWLKNLLKE